MGSCQFAFLGLAKFDCSSYVPFLIFRKDDMDWDLAIERNRTALLRLLAIMIAAAGLVEGRIAPVLPRPTRLMILKFLRPAEAATRRLAVILMKRMKRRKGGSASRKTRPMPAGGIPKGERDGQWVPPFRLFDPRKHFPELSQDRKRRPKGPGPRISGFDDDSWTPYEPQPAAKTEPDPRLLAGRLLALQAALLDLPKQARRLARVQSRRRAAGEPLRRTEPMRPAMPPGHRWTHSDEIDEILSDCHWLALRAMAAPDTS